MRHLALVAFLAIGCVTAEDHPNSDIDQRGDSTMPMSGNGGSTGAGGAGGPDAGDPDTTPPPVCMNPYPYVWSPTLCAGGTTGLCNVQSNAGVVVQSYLAYAGCVLDQRLPAGIGGVLCVAACP